MGLFSDLTSLKRCVAFARNRIGLVRKNAATVTVGRIARSQNETSPLSRLFPIGYRGL